MLSHSARLRQRIHEAFAASSAAMYPAGRARPVYAEPIHGSARALPEEQFDQRFQAAQTISQATLPAEQRQRLEDMHQMQMRTSPVHASAAPLTGDAYMAERFAIAQSGPRVVLSPEEQLVLEELDRIQIGVSADRLMQSQSVNAGRSESADAYLTWFEREFGFFGRALGRGGRRLTVIPRYGEAMALMRLASDVGRTREDILQEEIERYQGATTLQDLTPLAQASALQATQLRYDYIRDDGEAERLEYIRLAAEALASAQSILAVVAQIEMSDAATSFRDVTLANADNSVMGTLQAFIDDPLNGAAFLTETAAESLPLLAIAGGASLATGQPLVGAAVLAGGSFLEESSTAALQWLADNNVDISTPEAAAAALQNGDLMRQAQAHGLTRGVMIALFDAVSGGVAGRTLARSPAGDLVLQGLAQAAFGAGGEAAASYATTGEVDARDAVIEGLASGVTTPATVLAMRGPDMIGTRPDDIQISSTDSPRTRAGFTGERAALIDQLVLDGAKITPENVVEIRRIEDRVIWLETGGAASGLQHIIEEHMIEFAQRGFSEDQIPDVVFAALNQNNVVFYQGKGTGRPVYEFDYQGQIYRLAITVGSNGYIIGANFR